MASTVVLIGGGPVGCVIICNTHRAARGGVREASPSLVYGAALLMRLGASTPSRVQIPEPPLPSYGPGRCSGRDRRIDARVRPLGVRPTSPSGVAVPPPSPESGGSSLPRSLAAGGSTSCSHRHTQPVARASARWSAVGVEHMPRPGDRVLAVHGSACRRPVLATGRPWPPQPPGGLSACRPAAGGARPCPRSADPVSGTRSADPAPRRPGPNALWPYAHPGAALFAQSELIHFRPPAQTPRPGPATPPITPQYSISTRPPGHVMLSPQRRTGPQTAGARSSTDRAFDYGSKGCRFESCRARSSS